MRTYISRILYNNDIDDDTDDDSTRRGLKIQPELLSFFQSSPLFLGWTTAWLAHRYTC